jgi:WD40 repeat protein
MKEKFVQKAFRLAWYLIAFGSFKLVWSQNVSLANHTNTVCSIKFTSDSHGNRFLVSSSTDGKINFWNKADPNWSLKDQINNGGSVNSIISLPNEQLASSLDGNIKVWSVLNKTLIKTLTRYSYGIFQLAISPNQQMIASAENDYASRVWNISTGKCISTMYGHTNSVQSVVFFSNEILITGSYDTSIKVWNITNVPGTCLRTLTGHTLTVVSLVVLPNSLLASGAADSSIKIWNVRPKISCKIDMWYRLSDEQQIMLSKYSVNKVKIENRVTDNIYVYRMSDPGYFIKCYDMLK